MLKTYFEGIYLNLHFHFFYKDLRIHIYMNFRSLWNSTSYLADILIYKQVFLLLKQHGYLPYQQFEDNARWSEDNFVSLRCCFMDVCIQAEFRSHCQALQWVHWDWLWTRWETHDTFIHSKEVSCATTVEIMAWLLTAPIKGL